jgi:hypothetical protein
VQTEATPSASSAAAAACKPRKKAGASHAQPPQQTEPPHIQYDLNVAVGSYSDINRCSVNLDEQEHDVIPPSRTSSSPGSSNGNGSRPSTRPASRTAFGTGSWSDGRSDDVHGLVYGATVRFSDSAALRLRRRAMVVWEEVSESTAQRLQIQTQLRLSSTLDTPLRANSASTKTLERV